MLRAPRKRTDRPCSICAATPTILVFERVPGSKGRTSASFVGSYRLCWRHRLKAEQLKAVERMIRRYGEDALIVLAKTFAILKGEYGGKDRN